MRQNGGKTARVLTAAQELRTTVTPSGEAVPPLEYVRRTHPAAYLRAVQAVEWSAISMPLPRLQRFPSGLDEFIYRIGWTVEQVEDSRKRTALEREVRAYQAGRSSAFMNSITLLPGVAATMARFHGILRELVEARWERKVRELNRGVLHDPNLRGHLFGIDRAALQSVRDPLRDLQDNRCFYCETALRQCDVDHFMPWARYPNDRVENLVVACAPCNGSKSDHLPDLEHLHRWLARLSPNTAAGAQLAEIARTRSWPRGELATVAVARHLYGHHPDDAPLWFARSSFRSWARGRADTMLQATIDVLNRAA